MPVLPPAEHALTISGEFADRERERAFQDDRLGETLRFARLVFVVAVVVNGLFLVSDWRFYGQEHFVAAVSSRLFIIATALAALAGMRRCNTYRGAELVTVAWQVAVAPAAAILVSPRTDLAVFGLFLVPGIYYLCATTSFRWRVAGGLWCSAVTLTGYLWWPPFPPTAVGLGIALVTLNIVLAVVLSRANRLRRLEWAATQAERQAKERLADSKEMLERIFAAVPIPLVISAKEDGRIVRANQAAWGFYGEDGRPPIAGKTFANPEDRRRLIEMLDRYGMVEAFETRMRLSGGCERDVLLAAAPIEIDGIAGMVTGTIDITSRKQMESHLERLATTDPLTGLCNRIRFFSLTRAEIQRADRYGRPLALAMVDIDHFKLVNDTHGHECGDQLLRAFAEMCRATLRHQDVVARLGGEEFALLLPETTHDRALHLAERLRGKAELLELPDTTPAPHITISVGVSEVFAGETEPDAALARADQALYAAKRGGRNRVMGYQPAAM